MLISARQAATLLGSRGLNYDRARLLLATGVAGEGIRTSASLLYEEDRVRSLLTRRFLNLPEIAHACPDGLLVGRLSRQQTVDLTEPAEAQRDQVSGPWPVPWYRQMIFNHRAKGGRPMPFVATVSGFILVGADVVGVTDVGGEKATFELAEPGVWFDQLRDRRWLTGRGGPALLLWRRPWRVIPPLID